MNADTSDYSVPHAGPRDKASSGPSAALRTRIVLAEVARGRPATKELAEQSPVGDALLRGLVRAQLAHAMRFASVVLVGLGGLPILFALVPAVARAKPLGLSLPWLLLGVCSFPFLYAVGTLYVRVSEHTEKEFTDLVHRDEV